VKSKQRIANEKLEIRNLENKMKRKNPKGGFDL